MYEIKLNGGPRRIAAILAAVLSISPVGPVFAAGEFNPLLELGLYGGGENLVDTTDSDLTAGGGVEFAAGALYTPSADSPYAIKGTIGYRFMDVEFINPNLTKGDSDFSVIPITVVALYQVNKLGIGAGITYHLSPEWGLNNVFGLSGTVEFDNAFGFVLSGEYAFTPTFYAGVQFSSIDYKVQGLTADAGGFGLYLGLKMP